MKNENKSLTVKNASKLKSLAKEISATYNDTDGIIASAQERGIAALKSAVKCGNALIEAKALVEHGEWVAWLETNCRNVSLTTCQNYMRLAKNPNALFFDDPKTLKQAYVETGILPSQPARKALPAPADAAALNGGGSVALDGVSRPPGNPLPAAEAERIQSEQPKRVVDGVPTESQAAQLKEIADFAAVLAEQSPADRPVERVEAESPIDCRVTTEQMGSFCTRWLDTAAGREWLAANLTVASVQDWLDGTEQGRAFFKEVVTPPQISPDDAALLAAVAAKEKVVIDVKPPMTVPRLRAALKSLHAAIPVDGKHAEFADAFSDFYGKEKGLADDRPHKPQGQFSAYTSR